MIVYYNRLGQDAASAKRQNCHRFTHFAVVKHYVERLSCLWRMMLEDSL